MAGTQLRMKQFTTWINQLKNIGPTSNAPIKFITEKTPFDNDDGGEPPKSENLTIIGRLLPNSDLYNQGSIQIEIILGPQCPFKPPEVRLKTKIYHPNVDKDGLISFDLLSRSGSWTAVSNLVLVVQEVTKIIDQPSEDMILYPEAASLFKNDYQKYRQIASETFQKNGLPRN